MRLRPDTWDGDICRSVLVDNEYGLPDNMRGYVVLDIGAHIGAFAIACQKRYAKSITCYEPDPENFELLAHNVNDDVENATEVTVIQMAVAGKTRKDAGIRRLKNHDFGRRNTGHVDIFGDPDGTPCCGINDAIKCIGEPIDILKIDCEGAEWSIFEEIDLTDVRAITAELHAVESDHPALDDIRGKSLVDLTENAIQILERAGFATTVTYNGPDLAKLVASRPAVVDITRKRPRLLWIGDAVITTGYARVTENICRRLVNKGWDVRVLGIGYNGDPHNLPYKIYPAVDPNVGGQRNGLSRIQEIIKRLKPDVAVIQDDSWNVGFVIDNMAMLNATVPTVGYVAVDSENVRGDVAAQLRNLKHVICHTQFGVEQLVRAGYTGKISVAGHGVDTNIYTQYSREEARSGIPLPRGNPQDAFIWGVVGMNQPRKRLDLSIAYWAAWWKAAGKPDNAYLYIHTNADGVWDLKQIADHCGIRGRFFGTDGGQVLGDTEMPSLYNSFDVLLSTNEGESFGLCHLEAAACGIPQIAVRCGALPYWAGDAIKWVEPSVYVFTANRTNTKRWIATEADYVKVMQEMYENADLRKEYSVRGPAKAAEFKWDDIGAHFDNVLRQILDAQRKVTLSKDALSEF